MTDFLNWLNGEIIWGPPLIALIIITGVYVTVRSGFFQVRHLGYIFKRTLGCILRKDHVQDENDKGLLSPYEAIATAVGGSVGFGNIAGVATAVTTGGPGAVLWMWLTAFIGMLIKQVEVTLAVYYRRTDEEGNPYGGPTYYMEYGLGEERHWGKKWLPLAFIFGLGIFSTFFISASNFTTSEVLAQSFGVKQELASLMLVIFIYALIWRGVKNLSKIFVKLVPVMSLGYMLGTWFPPLLPFLPMPSQEPLPWADLQVLPCPRPLPQACREAYTPMKPAGVPAPWYTLPARPGIRWSRGFGVPLRSLWIPSSYVPLRPSAC